MNNNMLFIPRPGKEEYSAYKQCASCSDLGPTDPLIKIGPRRSRTKVIEQIK